MPYVPKQRIYTGKYVHGSTPSPWVLLVKYTTSQLLQLTVQQLVVVTIPYIYVYTIHIHSYTPYGLRYSKSQCLPIAIETTIIRSVTTLAQLPKEDLSLWDSSRTATSIL